MKVDGRNNGLLIFDLAKLQKKESAQGIKSAESPLTDKVSTLTSKKLSETLSAIESGKFLPDDIHSGLKADKVAQLLDEKSIDKVKVRPSDSVLLRMADEVASEMLKQPELSVRIYSKLRADRTAEVL